MNRILFTAVTCIVSVWFFSTSCNRTTSKDQNLQADMETETIQPAITDAGLITPAEPFKNQPNKLCTVIRKLDISYYNPKKEVEDVSQYPKKYCLLDVCLDGPSSNGNIVNLGGADEMVTSSYELIKVFNSYEETKSYVEKYLIEDVVYEE